MKTNAETWKKLWYPINVKSVQRGKEISVPLLVVKDINSECWAFLQVFKLDIMLVDIQHIFLAHKKSVNISRTTKIRMFGVLVTNKGSTIVYSTGP